MIKLWFVQRTSLQQKLLVFGTVGLALLLLMALVLLPLHRSLATLRATHVSEAAVLQDVQELARSHALLLNDSEARADSGVPLIARLNQSLEQQPFQPQRIQQGVDGELQLRVEEVEFEVLLGWLHELERTPGVLLDAVSLSRAASGKVSANLTLRSL